MLMLIDGSNVDVFFSFFYYFYFLLPVLVTYDNVTLVVFLFVLCCIEVYHEILLKSTYAALGSQQTVATPLGY